jgi:phosphonate transport system substrate-binding protein
MDRGRRRFCLAAALALALAGLGRGQAAEAKTLRLGLMPVYGIRSLMSRYEPMRSYLSRLLGQAVRVETAPDFRRYLASILAGEFDIAVAGAHFARIAQKDKGWIPLAQFEPDNDTLLIVRAGEKPSRPADLVGKEVAVIDRLAITVMGAVTWLDKQGLKADQDYRLVEYHNHASVVHSLLSGASAMAVTTSHGFNQIPADQRARVEVYQSLFDLPAFVIMAAPGTPKAVADTLRRALLAFPSELEGLDFMGQNSYTGLRAADAVAMRRADPYLKETRRMLGR